MSKRNTALVERGRCFAFFHDLFLKKMNKTADWRKQDHIIDWKRNMADIFAGQIEERCDFCDGPKRSHGTNDRACALYFDPIYPGWRGGLQGLGRLCGIPCCKQNQHAADHSCRQPVQHLVGRGDRRNHACCNTSEPGQSNGGCRDAALVDTKNGCVCPFCQGMRRGYGNHCARGLGAEQQWWFAACAL